MCMCLVVRLSGVSCGIRLCYTSARDVLSQLQLAIDRWRSPGRVENVRERLLKHHYPKHVMGQSFGSRQPRELTLLQLQRSGRSAEPQRGSFHVCSSIAQNATRSSLYLNYKY